MSSEPLDWRFSQCFGEKGRIEDLMEADILSAVQFDHTGNYLATGDRGGRMVLFERNQATKFSSSRSKRVIPEYNFYTEFQSHEPEFDYLKSVEIEEKINQIRWLNRTNNALMLLSTNDKTVKLWKISEKQVKAVSGVNIEEGSNISSATARPLAALRIPKIETCEPVVAATPRRVFSNGHAYHINAISPNSDMETFLSSDDLRINTWNMDYPDHPFTVVDIKPANSEDLTEVITSAEYHPVNCHQFIYSSSKGTIKMADMRAKALCNEHAKFFCDYEDESSRPLYSEVIGQVSDIKFTKDGRHIITRDYMSVKVWDVRMERRPTRVTQVHEYLRSCLCELYQNKCIFDKFEVSVSGDGSHFVTGSYNNHLHIYDRFGKSDTLIEASKAVPRRNKNVRRRKDPYPEPLDLARKVMHISWHPNENIIAVGGLNNLYIYSAL